MTQKQTFFKNIVDSTMSIPLDLRVNRENCDNFSFNDIIFKEKSIRFNYNLRNNESKYFFNVTFYKIPKKSWFSGDISEYYLRVETREITKYSDMYTSTDLITAKDFDVKQLKKMFDFLEERIEQIRFKNEESKYSKINTELIKLVDKSLSRDEKLTDLLKN